MKAIRIYRISRFFYLRRLIFISRFFDYLNYFFHNSYISGKSKIGENTFFAYGGIGVVLHNDTIVGDNCMLGQGITIGGRSGSKSPPIIGDNVYISAGARVLGDIEIGDNSTIGANAVVIKDVPENSIVAGVPAKLIRYKNKHEINEVKG